MVENADRTSRGWLRRWAVRISIGIVGLLVLALGLVVVAERHTAQPDFCGSCHIMEPYYESWQADLHGGKLDIACVDCHYAPGERTTVNAKLRGLSQVASYFSGRYGSTRPRAHVSNESCMTSKCHGDEKFMDQEIVVGTVNFRHSKHLRMDAQEQKDLQEELAALRQDLEERIADEQRTAELVDLARQVGPAGERIEKMVDLVRAWDAGVGQEEVERLSQLYHRQVRIAQLQDLQCTSCHSYSIRDNGDAGSPETHHFTVNTTSCFTCHFNNEGFNTGTNTCLMCHELPTEEITIHEQLTREESEQLESAELAQQPVRMDHQMILEREVSCIACHADVAREDSQVTRRDCERCHNQPDYYRDWKQRLTVDVVADYHEVHVPQQRAKCLDCHSEIHHQLIPESEDRETDFLTSVMSNCTNCHPNHHSEQLSLLRGEGGLGVPSSTPNTMFGSRTNCLGCHSEQATEDHLGEVVRASESGCTACHGDRYTETYEQWKMGVELVQMDAEEAFNNARQMLEESTDASDEARERATQLLTEAKADLMLVKRGNGMHNATYAIELLDSVTSRAQQAMQVLSAEE